MEKEYQKIGNVFKFDEKFRTIVGFNEPYETLKDIIWQGTEKVDGCLHSHTNIVMADGTTKYINKIVPGDLVLGYDIENNEGLKIVEVQGVQKQSRAGAWVNVKTTRIGLNKGNNYGLLKCTFDHKIYTKNRGYVPAYLLTDKDIILNVRNDLDLTSFLPAISKNQYHKLIVEEKVISVIPDTKSRERWDIQTETHNFFTTAGLVHNTNIRVHWDGHDIEFAGHTDKAQIPSKLQTYLESVFKVPEMEYIFEQVFGESEAYIFGEGFGAGINKSGEDYIENRTDVSFIVFDVQIDGWDLNRVNTTDVANKLGLPSVPVVFEGTLDQAKKFVAEHHMSSLNGGKHEMEGLVLVPRDIQLYDKKHKLIKCKCKYRDMKKAGILEETLNNN